MDEWAVVDSGEQDHLPSFELDAGGYLLELRFPFEVPGWLAGPLQIGLGAFLPSVRVTISAGGLVQITWEVR